MSAPDPQPISLFELVDADEPRRRRRTRPASTSPLPGPPATAAPRPGLASITELPMLLTMIEAAALLRIGRTTIYKLAETWRVTGGAEGIPTVRIGTKLFVRRADLERIVSGPDEAA